MHEVVGLIVELADERGGADDFSGASGVMHSSAKQFGVADDDHLWNVIIEHKIACLKK